MAKTNNSYNGVPDDPPIVNTHLAVGVYYRICNNVIAMAKKSPWFKKVRGSYLPDSWQGWLTYVPFIIFLLSVLMAAIRNEHSASDAFYMIFPQWVAAAVVMTWVAKQKT